MADEHLDSGRRWKSFSRTSFFISASVIAVPIAVSAAAALVVSHLVPRGHTLATEALWWIAVLGTAGLLAIGAGRLSRRLLPLAALLKMSMLFPDKAPSRLAVLRKVGSTRGLKRQLHAEEGTHSELNSAAIEILALATALGQHDRRTRGHSERVRALADLIADEMHLPMDDRDRLRWSALLHDIGKMTVHPDLLNKTGELTDEDWATLRQHPLEGRRLIAPLQAWLGDWSLTVEQHHENFDGTGYPFGLAGNEISLGARIVAVADSFEVMTSSRSYKSASSPSEARNELTRCAGTQFDPAVVRAFLNVSLGRLRWIIGPLSWLFDVPFVSQIGNLGRAAALTSQTTALVGTLAVGALVAGSQVPVQHSGAVTPVPAVSSGAKGAAAGASYQPSISLQGSSSTMTLGSAVDLTATLSGAGRGAGGTVTYRVYDSASCAAGGLVATLGPVTVTDGSVPQSPPWTATGAAGTYYVTASYSGDADDTSVTSACSNDPITVSQDQPGIETQLSATTVMVGNAVHDTAVLTDVTTGAGGTVAYSIFDNDDCSGSDGLIASLAPVSVTDGSIPDSPAWSPTSAGTYYFVASYSGDLNDEAARSGCGAEPLSVVAPAPAFAPPPPSPSPPAPPPSTVTIATHPSATEVPIDGSVYATSTLSGEAPGAGGTVTYSVYDTAACDATGLVATLGPVSTTGGAVGNSPPWTPTSAGTYYFVASYSGDGADTAATSDCASAPVTVPRDGPTIATLLSAPTVAIGGSVHDSAALSGASATAGGIVMYLVYDNDTCSSSNSGLVTTLGPVSVTNGSVPVSPEWTATVAAGTYYVEASYSGDANNTAAASGCTAEPLTVSPDQPTLSTQLSATTVAVGGSVYDTAILSGGTSNAGGTVTYRVYDNDTCAGGAGLVTTLGPVSVVNGGVPDSPDWTPNASGAYYVVASYSGDADNTATIGGCAAEPLTVSPDQPTLSTQLSATTVAVGGSVYDTAVLSGGASNAGGTVTYLVYDNDTCTGGGGGLVTTLGPVGVTNGSVPDSPDWTATVTAGTYYFVASYSGDANNMAAASGCTAGPLTVSPDQPTISTQLSATTVAVGDSVYDTAILSGEASNAGGPVTYLVYDNDTCAGGAGLVATLGPVSVTDGSVPNSPDWTPNAAGAYYVVASYSGDASDTTAISGCAAEPLTVSPDQPTISTQLSTATVVLGGAVYDSATLSGASPDASGTVTYLVYDNDTCAGGAGLVATFGPVSVTADSVPNSPDWTPNAAGVYYVVASYSGDSNNTTTTSGCAAEPLTVSPDQPSVSTQLSTATVVFGGAVYDSATLSGASAGAGGTVTYLVYDNDTCSSGSGGLVATLGPVSVTNGSVPDSPDWTPSSAGSYYFMASYSGDLNDAAAASGCMSEPLTVNPDQPSVSTQLSAPTVAIGGSVSDTSTLSGASAGASGTVTYLVYDNDTCSSGSGGLAATLGPVTVTNGSVPNSPDWTATGTAGTYYFVASYSGDANNLMATSGCGSEPIAVTPDTPTISTQLSATTVAGGGSVTDTSALSGASAGAGGTVTYLVYDNDTCSSGSGGLVATLGPVAVTNGTVPNSPGWTPTTAGTYYFEASYSGDGSNLAATSGCASEPLTVTTSVIEGALAITNGPGGNAGRAEQGDTIVVTFTTPPDPSSFCTGWTDSSQPELSGPNIVITATETGGGDGMIASVDDYTDCGPGGFHFGSIDLGQNGYFNGTVTFGGLGVGCGFYLGASCSSIQWNGTNTLTITLGASSTGNPTQPGPSVAVYTPDPALGYTGTLSSPDDEHF